MLVLFQVKAYFCILLFDFIIVYIKRVTIIQQFASDTSKCITSCESEVTHPESVIRVAVKCSQLEAEKLYQGQILIIQNILTLKYKKKNVLWTLLLYLAAFRVNADGNKSTHICKAS